MNTKATYHRGVFAIAMALLISLVLAPAALADPVVVDETTTGTITVNGIEDGDTVTVYPIVNAVYDKDNNNITYTVVDAAKDDFATVEDLQNALDADPQSSHRKNC